MTLFKKVFPNEARPAQEDESIDEEALRAAFQDIQTGSAPYVLDPFEHAVKKQEEDVLSDEDPHVTKEDSEDADTSSLVPFDDVAEDENDVEVLEAEPEGSTNTEQHDSAYLEKADTNLVADTDEQIADFMSRALGDETPAVDKAEQNDMPETSGEAQQDDLNLSEDAAVAEVIDMESASHNPEPPAEPEETPELDDFARQQLAGLRSSLAESDAPQAVDGEDDTATDIVEPDGSRTLTAVPDPATGRSGRRAGRVKTRLLGFNRNAGADDDPFAQSAENTASAQTEKFPVGWLVIVDGPGVGHAFSIFGGASVIGRGEDQMIRLDYGDNTISRNNHAAVAYDEESNKFYIGHGGKSNIIRRNARPVLSTEEMNHADLLRIGETTLKFVALCGPDFQWHGPGETDAASL